MLRCLTPHLDSAHPKSSGFPSKPGLAFLDLPSPQRYAGHRFSCQRKIYLFEKTPRNLLFVFFFHLVIRVVSTVLRRRSQSGTYISASTSFGCFAGKVTE